MVQTLSTNAQNDIYVARNGNIAVDANLQAVLIACENASKTQLGEAILATKNGVPNFQAVWVGSPNLALFRSYLVDVLVKVPGVLEVQDVQVIPGDGVLQYTATILTIYGEGVISNGRL